MRHVQLRAFHQVALQGSFTRAAEVLHVTQPAISDQIRKLEEQYDILLFNRTKRQVTLTWAGQALLEITRRLFDAEEQALHIGNMQILHELAAHSRRILSLPKRLSVRRDDLLCVRNGAHLSRPL